MGRPEVEDEEVLCNATLLLSIFLRSLGPYSHEGWTVPYDLVIRNGLVIDGTSSPGFEADVAVEEETISAIGKNLGLSQKVDGVRAIAFTLEEAVWKVTGFPSSS